MIVAASRHVAALLMALAAALPCHAESFASSSASSASSASIGSVSDSLTSASGSSTAKVAEGDYRIVEVAAAERPDRVRLKLQPVANEPDAAAFNLDVPRTALGDREAAVGAVVGVRQRPYGYEFAWGDTRVAFFLALAADWHRELEPRPL